jgi:hypothetical protein
VIEVTGEVRPVMDVTGIKVGGHNSRHKKARRNKGKKKADDDSVSSSSGTGGGDDTQPLIVPYPPPAVQLGPSALHLTLNAGTFVKIDDRYLKFLWKGRVLTFLFAVLTSFVCACLLYVVLNSPPVSKTLLVLVCCGWMSGFAPCIFYEISIRDKKKWSCSMEFLPCVPEPQLTNMDHRPEGNSMRPAKYAQWVQLVEYRRMFCRQVYWKQIFLIDRNLLMQSTANCNMSFDKELVKQKEMYTACRTTVVDIDKSAELGFGHNIALETCIVGAFLVEYAYERYRRLDFIQSLVQRASH